MALIRRYDYTHSFKNLSTAPSLLLCSRSTTPPMRLLRFSPASCFHWASWPGVTATLASTIVVGWAVAGLGGSGKESCVPVLGGVKAERGNFGSDLGPLRRWPTPGEGGVGGIADMVGRQIQMRTRHRTKTYEAMRGQGTIRGSTLSVTIATSGQVAALHRISGGCSWAATFWHHPRRKSSYQVALGFREALPGHHHRHRLLGNHSSDTILGSRFQAAESATRGDSTLTRRL